MAHMATTSADVLTISHDHHPDTRIARDHSHAPRDTFPPTATLARPHHSEMEFASITVRTDRPPPPILAPDQSSLTIVTIVTIVTSVITQQKHRAIKRHRVMKSKKTNPSDAPGDSNSPPHDTHVPRHETTGTNHGIAVGELRI